MTKTRALVLALAVTGCAAEPSPSPAIDGGAAAAIDPPAAEAPVPDDTVFTITAVTLVPGGEPIVKRSTITAGDQRAKPLAFRQMCGSAGAFSLWDSMDYTGDEICFNGIGTVNLSQYIRYSYCFPGRCVSASWQIQSGSFAANWFPGTLNLIDGSGQNAGQISFAAGEGEPFYFGPNYLGSITFQ